MRLVQTKNLRTNYDTETFGLTTIQGENAVSPAENLRTNYDTG